MSKVDQRHFRQIMGCFATGITVVALDDEKLGRVGITINSFTSVSLAPPLILFCLDKKAHLRAAFRNTKEFTVNILAEGQQDTSQYFANYHKFPKPKKLWDSKHDHPVLSGSLGWLRCKKVKTYAGGDHDIVLAEVIGLSAGKGSKRKPLLYFSGGYKDL